MYENFINNHKRKIQGIFLVLKIRVLSKDIIKNQ